MAKDYSKERKWENRYPYVLGGAIAVIYLAACWGTSYATSLKDFFQAIINYSGIAIAFLATMKAVLLTSKESKVFRDLRQTGHFDALASYMMQAVYCCFGLAAVSILALFVDLNAWRPYSHFGISVFIFLMVASGLSCYRVISLLAHLLRL